MRATGQRISPASGGNCEKFLQSPHRAIMSRAVREALAPAVRVRIRSTVWSRDNAGDRIMNGGKTHEGTGDRS